MKKIMFVCHGNICRSPMAEFIFKDLLVKHHLHEQYFVTSCATSREEIGNHPHQGTLMKLREKGIPTNNHTAVQLTIEDASNFDYLIAMDDYNIRNMERLVGLKYTDKMFLLKDFTDTPGNIADPWYTGDFDETYQDIMKGCLALLETLTHH